MADQNKRGAVMNARTISRATEIMPIIRGIQASGITSASGIAAALNHRGVPTVQGGAWWQAVQVQRVLAKPPERPYPWNSGKPAPTRAMPIPSPPTSCP